MLMVNNAHLIRVNTGQFIEDLRGMILAAIVDDDTDKQPDDSTCVQSTETTETATMTAATAAATTTTAADEDTQEPATNEPATDDDDSEDRDEAARHMPTEQFDPVSLRRNRRRLVAIMV